MVDDTFDYEAEKKMILKMIEDKIEFMSTNRPMTKKALDSRPPIEDHIKHIEKRYEIEWLRDPKPILNYFANKNQNNE